MIQKRTDVHRLIGQALELDKVRLSRFHGNLRSEQRKIGTVEIRDVIFYGEREEETDSIKSGHWIYAFRNRDVDGSDTRIFFDVERYPDVIIVTVMRVYP